MKVFISSVRRGLESERDALPGLLRAVGHEPLRFEDFTAQAVPSREACLSGVAAADVYVLLLGQHYGTTFPDTGRSATHEEYIAAQARGIPRLVFRKSGVDFEPDQQTFAAEVESFATGLFRDSFVDAVDLQAKVVSALRELPVGALEWKGLDEPVAVRWNATQSPRYMSPRAELYTHAMPIGGSALSKRRIAELPDHLAQRLRSLGTVSASAPIDTGVDDHGAYALVTEPDRRGWREADAGGLSGCRIHTNGQRTAIERLPTDSMGTILDREDLVERVARSLRLLGALAPAEAGEHAIALEMVATSMAIIGSIGQLGNRNSASGLSTSDQPIRVEPDESVTIAAFDRGAYEVARPLVHQLLEAFSRRR